MTSLKGLNIHIFGQTRDTNENGEIKVSLYKVGEKWENVFWQKIDTTQNSHYHKNNVISDVAAGGSGSTGVKGSNCKMHLQQWGT